jgi:hypothetical protein
MAPAPVLTVPSVSTNRTDPLVFPPIRHSAVLAKGRKTIRPRALARHKRIV